MPNAKVITINTGTRVHYETVTNETGSCYVTNLPPGTHRIEVKNGSRWSSSPISLFTSRMPWK